MSPLPSQQRSDWNRRIRTIDDLLWGTPLGNDPDSPHELRRRRVVSLATLLAGAAALALSLRMPQDSPWFPLAALGVAGIWATGGLLAGRLHLGRVDIDAAATERFERPVLPALLIGAGLAVIFVAGAYLTLQVPFLAEEVRRVLGYTSAGSLWIITVTTLLSGLAEELFFRGALYAAIPRRHQIWLTTALYAVATSLTGNVMLGFAAAVLGLVTALERRTTGGVLAPMITHVTWSMAMLHLLPHIL